MLYKWIGGDAAHLEPGHPNGLSAWAYGRECVLGLGRARLPLRGAQAKTGFAARRWLHPLRHQPLQDLPLRPPEPELGAACALVPRGRRSPAPRRVFLPAPERPVRRAIAF